MEAVLAAGDALSRDVLAVANRVNRQSPPGPAGIGHSESPVGDIGLELPVRENEFAVALSAEAS
jgi:hypothetical protein